MRILLRVLRALFDLLTFAFYSPHFSGVKLVLLTSLTPEGFLSPSFILDYFILFSYFQGLVRGPFLGKSPRFSE